MIIAFFTIFVFMCVPTLLLILLSIVPFSRRFAILWSFIGAVLGSAYLYYVASDATRGERALESLFEMWLILSLLVNWFFAGLAQAFRLFTIKRKLDGYHHWMTILMGGGCAFLISSTLA